MRVCVNIFFYAVCVLIASHYSCFSRFPLMLTASRRCSTVHRLSCDDRSPKLMLFRDSIFMYTVNTHVSGVVLVLFLRQPGEVTGGSGSPTVLRQNTCSDNKMAAFSLHLKETKIMDTIFLTLSKLYRLFSVVCTCIYILFCIITSNTT
jgi:hypothetical protein